jgi:DNA-directed RNA polymerase sigma subunit (sigma70/sigma32)
MLRIWTSGDQAESAGCGFEDPGQQTLEAVAQDLGISRERVRQIETPALRKLRHVSAARRRRERREN